MDADWCSYLLCKPLICNFADTDVDLSVAYIKLDSTQTCTLCSPDMTIFNKYNVMCRPKIRSFVSGVSIDFNGFLGVIFGNFILMIDVLVGRQRYIIVYPLLHTYMLLLLLERSKW